MFDQIIYTRNSFGRQLEKNGAEDKSSGYKVRSFSKEIYNHIDEKEIDLLSKLYIKTRNESKSTAKQGLINSFEYVKPVYGLPFFGLQHQRLPQEDKRPGNFIKHLYVGDVTDYPISYMNEKLYPYCDYPVEYYYEQNETCDFLPVKELEPLPKYNKKEIKGFYQDGRQQAIENAISFLVEQYQLPYRERKALIIKDEAENVLKWIACITYALPLELSKRISFSTNAKIDKGNVGTFMYCLDEQHTLVKYMPNNEELTTHLLYDIIGISPKTTASSSFKPLPNSPFVVIDGITKEASFSVSLQSHYLQFACSYDEGMDDFNHILRFFHSFDFQDLYEVYDIYEYLFKDQERPTQWDYKNMMQYLLKIQKYIKTGCSLENSLSVQLYKLYCSKGQWYDADSQNGFQLLRYIYQTSLASQREQYIESVKQMICKITDNVMSSDNFHVHTAKNFWHSLQKDKELYDFINQYYFNEESVDSKLKELEYIDDDIIFDYGYLMISLLNDYLTEKGLNKELFLEHPGWTGLLFNLYKAILSERYDSRVLDLVKQYQSDIMNILTMKFATMVGFNTPITKNWITLYGSRISDNNLYSQCQDMLQAGISPKAVELLLVTYMEKQEKTSNDLLKSFKLLFNYLDNDKSVGVSFFDQYLYIANLQMHKYQEILRLIDFVRKEQFSSSIQQTLLSKIDLLISPIARNKEEQKLINECFKWIGSLHVITPHLLKAKCIQMLDTLRKDQVKQFIQKVKKQSISVDESDRDFVYAFIGTLSQLIDDSQTFVDACNMFETNHYMQKQIIQEYSDRIAKRTRKDVHAVEICLDILCHSNMDRNIYDYIFEDGTKVLAEYYKEDLWLAVIERIRDKNERAKAYEMNDRIREMAREVKGFGFDKVFSSIFKKKR